VKQDKIENRTNPICVIPPKEAKASRDITI